MFHFPTKPKRSSVGVIVLIIHKRQRRFSSKKLSVIDKKIFSKGDYKFTIVKAVRIGGEEKRLKGINVIYSVNLRVIFKKIEFELKARIVRTFDIYKISNGTLQFEEASTIQKRTVVKYQ